METEILLSIFIFTLFVLAVIYISYIVYYNYYNTEKIALEAHGLFEENPADNDIISISSRNMVYSDNQNKLIIITSPYSFKQFSNNSEWKFNGLYWVNIKSNGEKKIYRRHFSNS
tara:strand:+ start:766 stop:1110 length:345 start_codon:yes stop_codon:yes gene_type:complete